MKLVRGLLAVAGISIIGVGTIVALGILPPIEVVEQDAVDFLGTDYLLVATVGVLALLVTLIILAAHTVTGIDQLEMPNPEPVPRAPRPGEQLDRYVNRTEGVRTHLDSDTPEQVRERLRKAAIGTLMRRHGITREKANRRIDIGRWTDDSEAAAYLGGPEAPRTAWSSRIRTALGGKVWAQHGAMRAARAVIAIDDRGDQH